VCECECECEVSECESECCNDELDDWEKENTSINVFGLAVDSCESRWWPVSAPKEVMSEN
jgi:hypothetical protein